MALFRANTVLLVEGYGPTGRSLCLSGCAHALGGHKRRRRRADSVHMGPGAAAAAGMDWRDLEALLKEERRAGNPMAALVAGLQVHGVHERTRVSR